MTEAEITAALRAVNERCDPALSDRELETIAHSMGRYAPAEGHDPACFVVTPLGDFMGKAWQAGEPIIEGLINVGETVFLFGQVGHGKTLEGCECAISVATGRRAFGVFPTRQGTVVFVEEDTHPAQLQKYLRMLIGAYGVNDAPIFVWERQFLRLDDDAQAQAFTDHMLDVCPRLIVFDAFLDLHSGDGFTGRELRPILDRIVALPQLMPCGVLILDHPKKEDSGRKGTPDPVDALYGGRMKSALADRMILTKRTSDSPPRFTLSIVKTRSEPRAPFTVTFGADDGFGVDEAPIGLTPSANAVLQWARTLAVGSTFTKQHIEGATGLATRTVTSAMHELKFNAMVQDAGHVGRAKAYRLTTSGERSETEDQQPQRPLLSALVRGGVHQDSGGVD